MSCCIQQFFEEESQFTKEEQERIIDNLNELLDINFEMSVDSFEHILKPMFHVFFLSELLIV